jgi:hypothetical protein
VARWFRHGLSVPALSSAGASLVTSCSVSTSRSSNRTCGFPASGSRTGCMGQAHGHVDPATSLIRIDSFTWSLAVLRGLIVFCAVIGISHSHSDIPLILPPELRPLSSPGITRYLQYYGPLRHPFMPGHSLAGFRLGSTHMRGFPCCSHRLLTCMPSPLPRLTDTALRSSYRVDGGLPCPNVRSAQHYLLSRPAQRSLTLGPVRSLIPQGNL